MLPKSVKKLHCYFKQTKAPRNGALFLYVARWLHIIFVNPYKQAYFVTAKGFEPPTLRAEI